MTWESISEFEKVGQNLYKKDKIYFRLFATSVTPNRCWLVNPTMVELIDIDIATSKDIYGKQYPCIEVMGVSADNSCKFFCCEQF